MEVFVIVSIVLALIFFFSKEKNINNSDKVYESLIKKTEDQIFILEQIINQNFPIEDSDILLKKGEIFLFKSPSILSETKSIRMNHGSGARVRIAKGISVGGYSSKGESFLELKELDSGNLNITNYRIIFNGQFETRDIPIKKIASIKIEDESLVINSSSRKKAMYFNSDFSDIEFIQFLTKFNNIIESNLSNLSQNNIELIKKQIQEFKEQIQIYKTKIQKVSIEKESIKEENIQHSKIIKETQPMVDKIKLYIGLFFSIIFFFSGLFSIFEDFAIGVMMLLWAISMFPFNQVQETKRLNITMLYRFILLFISFLIPFILGALNQENNSNNQSKIFKEKYEKALELQKENKK